MADGLRAEITRGPCWLPPKPKSYNRTVRRKGHWILEIERIRILGRLGWQIITETFPMPGESTGESGTEQNDQRG